MDTNTAEKFVNLLAECAVSGSSAELRKEAAAQELVKSANPLLWALPAAGAIGGGAIGYFGTDDEKRKKRNAIYGALTGGVGLGLGGLLMNQGSKILNDATARMGDANEEAAAKTPGAAPTGVVKTPDGKTTGLGKVMEFVPGGDAVVIATDPSSPMHPGNVYGDVNPLNIPGRAAGAGLGATAGTLYGAASQAIKNRRAARQARNQYSAGVSEKILQTPAYKQLNDIIAQVTSNSATAARTGWRGAMSRLGDFTRSRPQGGFRGAAADAMGIRPYTSGGKWLEWFKSLSPVSRQPQYQSKLRAANELARVSETGILPTNPQAANNLARALEEVEKSRAADTAAKSRGNPSSRPKIKDPTIVSPANPTGERHMTQREFREHLEDKARSTGDRAARSLSTASKKVSPTRMPAKQAPAPTRGGAGRGFRGGGLVGAMAAHPKLVETLMNYFYGSKLVEDQPSQ